MEEAAGVEVVVVDMEAAEDGRAVEEVEAMEVVDGAPAEEAVDGRVEEDLEAVNQRSSR